jgi:hypothetical protein
MRGREKMKRIQKNQKLFENLTEIVFQFFNSKGWNKFVDSNKLEDSTDQRNFAIDAALVFDEVERRLLKASENDWDFEWYDAIDYFVRGVLEDDTDDLKSVKKCAEKAIRNAGLNP